MSEIKIVGRLEGGPWDKRHDMIRRVYDTSGIAPTVDACGGGGTQIKILVGGDEMTGINMLGLLDMKGNETVRRVYGTDGISPTLTTSQGGHRQPKILTRKSRGVKKLKVNDLFCGAGGMGLGFKNAGFEIAGAWDFDKYAVQSYKHNVGDHVKQADISQMTWEDMPRADVWTFGFPCQDLSHANTNGKGLFEGKRSGLFFEVMRLLDETATNDADKLPDVIMAENVRGLKPYLETLREEYAARGYKMDYVMYNSKFWGVPQNRERYFVVGVREHIEIPFDFPWEQKMYVPSLENFLDEEVDLKFYMDEMKSKAIIGQAKEKGGQVRKLTPTEYKRLQGFPESYEIVVSDSQAYKQFGNAVSVPVAQAIAERIRMFLLSL